MTDVIYVALPVIQQSYEFQLEKGRRWNVVEHMILQSICLSSQTAGNISESGNMPRRVALEALIRLMRAGWVELFTKANEVLFVPTSRGREVASLQELPMTSETMNRRISFAVDMITGTIFKKRDLKLIREDEWARFCVGKSTAKIERPQVLDVDFGHSASIMRTLVRDDEKVIKIKPSQHPPLERLAIVMVRGITVDGLPALQNTKLEEIILRAAGERSNADKSFKGTSSVVIPPVRSAVKMRPTRSVEIRQTDYILGGRQHYDFLNKTILKARKILIIHSTFLRSDAAIAFSESLRTAVNRGVKVHIFWGQSDELNKSSSSREEAEKLRVYLASKGLSPNVTVHNASTGSHSKIIVADNGTNNYIAAIGSCNWLSSGFTSYEASVILRDHKLVADVLFELSEMVRPSNRDFPEISANFLELARHLLFRPSRGGSAKVKLLLGQDHDDCVLETRDIALRQVDVISHRLGVRAFPSVVVPMLAAASDRGVETELYYSKAVKPVTFEEAQKTRIEIKHEGVSLSAVHVPVVHAKMLLRDDDFSVITSLNWLSADARLDQKHQEIGVSIESPNTAKYLRDQFMFCVKGTIPS